MEEEEEEEERKYLSDSLLQGLRRHELFTGEWDMR